ncbi:hypothetical protein [Afifella pfennigii]|uniref:hypothetical protein n=1 Tax=Afifella pfennigii TaxID=209897 RepID=UPI00047D8115|nr:hypothetical protein [Afifella pfennigii]
MTPPIEIGLSSGTAPAPEDVLLAWLVWLPEGTDPGTAARQELQRTKLLHPTDPRLARLAALLREVAGSASGTA